MRWHLIPGLGLLATLLLSGAAGARADVVSDANAKAAAIASKHPVTPPSVRMMAIVQVSVFEAVNAITGRYPAFRVQMAPAPGASLDAAVAAATRTALLKLMPAQQASIDADYQALIGTVPDGPAKTSGIAVGEQAATAVFASCANDGSVAPDAYRPHTTAGIYVPTVIPAVPHWGKRKPWVMDRPDQFRPGPPPSLTSDTWTRDYNEVKALGARNSTQRTAEQTAMAKFWEATAPAVYWPVARSVATAPGRDLTDNARLLAVAGMAMDDALTAVFDAKYTYNFWRPVTAIRNGDQDGNDATERDASWTSQAMQDFAATRRLAIPPAVLRVLKERYLAARADDSETIATIARIYGENGIVIDPHTAVGVAAAEKLSAELKGPVVALATAHPAKFSGAVVQAIGKSVELPPHLSDLLSREERYTVLANSKAAVEEFVMERIKKT
jgi:hypothetical protein